MVRIITDSSADLEPREYEQLNITCIPLTVFFGDTEYQENVNLSKDQFYELLAGGQFPKTAQPSPQILLDLFEEAANAGDEAIYITLSSALSGTYQSAVMTKNLADSNNAYFSYFMHQQEAGRLIFSFLPQSAPDMGSHVKQELEQLINDFWADEE